MATEQDVGAELLASCRENCRALKIALLQTLASRERGTHSKSADPKTELVQETLRSIFDIYRHNTSAEASSKSTRNAWDASPVDDSLVCILFIAVGLLVRTEGLMLDQPFHAMFRSVTRKIHSLWFQEIGSAGDSGVDIEARSLPDTSCLVYGSARVGSPVSSKPCEDHHVVERRPLADKQTRATYGRETLLAARVSSLDSADEPQHDPRFRRLDLGTARDHGESSLRRRGRTGALLARLGHHGETSMPQFLTRKLVADRDVLTGSIVDAERADAAVTGAHATCTPLEKRVSEPHEQDIPEAPESATLPRQAPAKLDGLLQPCDAACDEPRFLPMRSSAPLVDACSNDAFSSARPQRLAFANLFREAVELLAVMYKQLVRDMYPILATAMLERLTRSLPFDHPKCRCMLLRLLLLHVDLNLTDDNHDDNGFALSELVSGARPCPQANARITEAGAPTTPPGAQLLSPEYDTCISKQMMHHSHFLSELWYSLEKHRTRLLKSGPRISRSAQRIAANALATQSAVLFGVAMPLAHAYTHWLARYLDKHPSAALRSRQRSRILRALLPACMQVTRVAVHCMTSSAAATRVTAVGGRSRTASPSPIAVDMLASTLRMLIDWSHAEPGASSDLCRAGICDMLRTLWGLDLCSMISWVESPASSVQTLGLPYDLRILSLALLVNLVEQSSEARHMLFGQSQSRPGLETLHGARVPVLTYLWLLVAASGTGLEHAGAPAEASLPEAATLPESAITAAYSALAVACALVQDSNLTAFASREIPELSLPVLTNILDKFVQLMEIVDAAAGSPTDPEAGLHEALLRLLQRLRSLETSATDVVSP
jgi:hypothetical protein